MSLKKGILAGALLLCTTAVFAAPNAASEAGAIQVKAPMVDSKIKQKNSAEVFMELKNIGQNRAEIIAATSPVAHKVQLHMTNRKGQMRQVSGIILRNHAEADMQMGGLHVMLIGLKKHLKPREKVPVTLIFRDGSWKTIHARVKV